MVECQARDLRSEVQIPVQVRIFLLNLNSIFSNNEIDDTVVVDAVINDAKGFCGKQWTLGIVYRKFFI